MTEDEAMTERMRSAVRSRYAAAAAPSPAVGSARTGSDCCGDSSSDGGCCGGGPDTGSTSYSTEERARLPAGANLGLGCGNPGALAQLRPGEIVVDLGSGAGVDCFLAGDRVGPSGRVIGVDMTPEMVTRARGLARRSGRANLEFRLGEIEHLPVADRTVDVVLSNCVVNLSVDKAQVYREAYRVLRPGGRLAISDVLATRPIPAEFRADPDRWSSCSSGALTVEETRSVLRSAGFADIDVALSTPGGASDSLKAQADIGVVPGRVRAVRPIEG